MGLPYFSFITNTNSIFLLGFVFVYFFCWPYIMSIRENRPNIFYRLERWGSRHIGPLAPVPLFEICSLFTPHLNWQSRIRLFFLNCYSRPFTNTAAILNKLDLRSIMGCPGGHEHNPFFFKFSKNKIVMGKRSLCRVWQPRSQGSLLTTLRVGRVGENSGNEVSVFDGLFPEKYTVKDYISTDRAHAPWTSHNTP